MARFIYRPDHPQANENGMVNSEEVIGVIPLNHSVVPYIIRDEMEPTRHMADNQLYTSKAKFREATRAAGCVEVGNDPAIMKSRRPVILDRRARREAIRQAIRQLGG